MSMSTHVIGFQPPDEEWEQMKSIYQSCQAACVDIPEQVLEFFDHQDPDTMHGREIELGDAASEWGAEGREGYEVEVAKLPENVKVIRFYNAW